MTREEVIKDLQENGVDLGGGDFVSVEALRAAISALREQPRWISVEERLPEVGVEVLVCDARCGFCSVWTLTDDEWWLNERDEMYELYEVTHWMPLPEAPKEDT